MKATFYDAESSEEICELTIDGLHSAPLVGDSVILLSSKEYEKVYGYDNRSGTVHSRLIDYRDDSITLFIK